MLVNPPDRMAQQGILPDGLGAAGYQRPHHQAPDTRAQQRQTNGDDEVAEGVGGDRDD